MMPFGGSGDDPAAAPDDRQPVADPPRLRTAPRPHRHALPSRRPPPGASAGRPPGRSPTPEPQGTSSATRRTSPTRRPRQARHPRPAGCRVAYALDSQWPDGFQATVTVTTEAALSGWRVSWTFRDGQRVGRTWDATVHQDGSRVTATAADYNKTVAAHGSLSLRLPRHLDGRQPDPARVHPQQGALHAGLTPRRAPLPGTRGEGAEDVRKML